MQAGTPLTDADRADWLDALHRLITQRDGEGKSAIIACSALKQSYRQVLGDVRIVYLKGDDELFRQRLQSRPGHFFKADLLPSQLATLEEPGDAITVDAGQEPAPIVQAIRKTLKM
jgi:gluconokinase